MRRHNFIPAVLPALAVLLLGTRPAHPGAPRATTTVPVQMVVTVEANHGKNVPAVGREDVVVYQGRERDE